MKMRALVVQGLLNRHGVFAAVSACQLWCSRRPQAWREPTTVGTVAACGFGGVLYKVLTSDAVIKLLTDILRRALTLSF
jgi:hypothetical protein